MRQVRQGDLLLVELDEEQKKRLVRKDEVSAENGQLILARGELSGHHHAVSAEDASMFVTPATGVDAILDVVNDTMLTHPEHEHIPLEKGKSYAVLRQREPRTKRQRMTRIAD